MGIVAVAVLLASSWLRQDGFDYAEKHFHMTMLAGEQNGYILNPPEFVAQPFIRRIIWSPRGDYAVLVQTALRFEGEGTNLQAEMRHRLLAWSRKTKRVSILWESDKTTYDIDPERDVQVVFFRETPACVFALPVAKFVSGGQGAGSWRAYHATIGGRTSVLGEFQGVLPFAPPQDNACYIAWYMPHSSQHKALEVGYAAVAPSGQLGEPRPLPDSMSGLAAYFFTFATEPAPLPWHADGRHLVLPAPYSEERDDPEMPAEMRYMLWNPRTNALRFITRAELRYYEPKAESALATEGSNHSLQYKATRDTTQATWLVEGEQATLVAADSAVAAVAPTGDAILYTAHGAAFYRTLIRLPAEAVRRMQEEAKVARYLSQGKQIAIAMLMYAQDYEENFPPNLGDEGVAQVLLPYLRSREVFEVDGTFAFRYLMDGENLANIQNLPETEVGYLQLPEGRIVLYADGHVKWKPNR
ncbi:MAG: hypothetical protein NZM10_06310 [Fimbriimonadales bacterium]|nr:hypothetical protein [Fimbriimonadales bacterium]